MYECKLTRKKDIPKWVNSKDSIDLNDSSVSNWLARGWIKEGKHFKWKRKEHKCSCGHKHKCKYKKYD